MMRDIEFDADREATRAGAEMRSNRTDSLSEKRCSSTMKQAQGISRPLGELADSMGIVAHTRSALASVSTMPMLSASSPRGREIMCRA